MGHASTVWEVAFDAEGRRMVSCSDDGTLKVWACRKEAGTLGTYVRHPHPCWLLCGCWFGLMVLVWKAWPCPWGRIALGQALHWH